MGSRKFMERFPRLYALVINKGCSIQEKSVNGGWYWTWGIQIRGGVKAVQLVSLTDCVEIMFLVLVQIGGGGL